MAEKERQKKDHQRTDKKNKRMHERENQKTVGAAPRHHARAESNLSDEKNSKSSKAAAWLTRH